MFAFSRGLALVSSICSAVLTAGYSLPSQASSLFEVGVGLEGNTQTRSLDLLIQVKGHGTAHESQDVDFFRARTEVQLALASNGTEIVERLRIRTEPVSVGLYGEMVGRDAFAILSPLPVDISRDVGMGIDSRAVVSIVGADFSYNLENSGSGPWLIPVARAAVDLVGVALLKEQGSQSSSTEFSPGRLLLEAGFQMGETDKGTTSLVAGGEIQGSLKKGVSRAEGELYGRLQMDIAQALLAGGRGTHDLGVYAQIGEKSDFSRGHRVVRWSVGVNGSW